MVKETVYDEVFDGQTHFRVLLDVMARPGTIQALNGVALTTPEGLHAAAALAGFALLNGDVCFHVADGSNEVESYLTVNTSSLPASADQADFIFLDGSRRTPAVVAAKVGTLRYPEEGATLVVGVEKIGDGANEGVSITLSGPGVPDARTVSVKGLDAGILADLVEKNVEFPEGIDAIFVDRDDQVMCVPRTAKLSWV